MAESKSEWFSFVIKRHSEKVASFGPNNINRLYRVSERRRERAMLGAVTSLRKGAELSGAVSAPGEKPTG
jgi:hypothetical protein